MDEAFGDYIATSMNNESIVNPTGRNVSNQLRYPINYIGSLGSLYGDSLIFSGAKWDLRSDFQSYGNSGNTVDTNGTYRADAIILETYKTRPRNYSEYMGDLMIVSAGSMFNNGGQATPQTAQDRPSICDAFNFKHSLLPNVSTWDSYCARKGDIFSSFNYPPGSQISITGANFAPRTSVKIYVLPYVPNREDGQLQGPFTPQDINVYGSLPSTGLGTAVGGHYDIIVDTDSDGLYNSSVDSLASFYSDSEAPTVELLSPQSTIYPNTSIDMEIIPDDPEGNLDTVWYELNGVRYTYSPGRQLVQIPAGNYTLVAYANDSVGHQSSTPPMEFTVINCSTEQPMQDISVASGQEYYLSIFNVTPNEFPPYQDAPVCRKFYLTNSGPIDQMTLRRLLIDDEGYVFVNGKYAAHWEDHPRAPLSNDINTEVTGNASLMDGATTEIMLYAKDHHNVVYGGWVQVNSGGECTAIGDPASQDSECCTGIRDETGLCAALPDGAYCEDWNFNYCSSQTCGERVCGGYQEQHGGNQMENGGETLPAGPFPACLDTGSECSLNEECCSLTCTSGVCG